MNRKEKFALGCLAFGLVVNSAHGEIVYDNLLNSLNLFVGGFPYEEAADDFTLGGTARVFESLTVAYAGLDFDGDETLTVSLYKMDGAPTPASFGFNTPGTVLFSQTVPIPATPGATITFSDPTVGVLPSTLAVGFAFTGINGAATAGPILFDPPSPGSSFNDMWLRGFPNAGDPWGLFTANGDPPLNLGIQIVAKTPEASDWLNYCGLATIVGLGWTHQFRKSKRLVLGS